VTSHGDNFCEGRVARFRDCSELHEQDQKCFFNDTPGWQAPLYRIPAAGGTRHPLTKLGPGEITQRWPQVLPGGRAVVHTASPSLAAEQREHRSRLPVDRPSQNFAAGRILRPLLPSGHLVYIHQGVLFGVKFDLEKLETRGAPVPLLEDVAANSATGGGQLDFSGPGTVVYAAGKNAAQAWQVVWLDGSGKTHPLVAAPGAYAHPRLSPDGRKLAFLGNGDIYIHDLSGRLPPPSPSRVMLTARYGRPTANISSSSPCRMASAFSGCAATAREIRNHCSSGRIL